MSDRSKKENLFAKLAQQTAQQQAAAPPTAEEREPVATTIAAPAEVAVEPPPPSPAPPKAVRRTPPAAPSRRAEAVSGKRGHPDYCQANAYVPKKLRREVDRALIDIEGMDYSSLVEDLLRKWLKSKGISA